jgi:hypothetical protein
MAAHRSFSPPPEISRQSCRSCGLAAAQDALTAAFVAGPVALAYSRFDVATRAAAQAECLASIEPHAVGVGYELPAEFVAAVGTRDTAA